MGLPREIVEKMEEAERMVERDLGRIQETLDELEAIPEETFDDPSFVRHVEDLRRVATVTERAARRSEPPPISEAVPAALARIRHR